MYVYMKDLVECKCLFHELASHDSNTTGFDWFSAVLIKYLRFEPSAISGPLSSTSHRSSDRYMKAY